MIKFLVFYLNYEMLDFLVTHPSIFPYSIPYVFPLMLITLAYWYYFSIKITRILNRVIILFFSFGWLLIFLIIPAYHVWSFISLFSWTLCFYSIILVLRMKNYSWLFSSIIGGLSVVIGSVVYELPIFYTMMDEFSSLLFHPIYPGYLSKLIISLILLGIILIKTRFKPNKFVISCLMLYVGFYPVYMIYPRIWGWIPRSITILLFLSIVSAFPNYKGEIVVSSPHSHSLETSSQNK